MVTPPGEWLCLGGGTCGLWLLSSFLEHLHGVDALGVIYYLRQGGNVFACFCLSVCYQDNSKNYGRIFLKFWGYVGHGISYKWFNFGRDPAGILDSGSLWNFRYHCVKGGIKEPLQNRRRWRHLANSIALAEVPAGYDCFLVVYCCLLLRRRNQKLESQETN